MAAPASFRTVAQTMAMCDKRSKRHKGMFVIFIQLWGSLSTTCSGINCIPFSNY